MASRVVPCVCDRTPNMVGSYISGYKLVCPCGKQGWTGRTKGEAVYYWNRDFAASPSTPEGEKL